MDLLDCKTMIDEGKQMIDLYEKHFGTCVRCHRGLMLYKDLVDRKRRKEAEPEPKEIVVYVGASGSGKSHHCWHDPDYRRSGYKYPLLAENKVWFDGYEGEEVLWVDEFRGSVFPFGLFLQVTDKWGARVEVKGGSIETFFKKVLISTTVPPGEWYKNCSNYLKNPKQLWRRLTKVYWLGPVEHDEDGFTPSNRELLSEVGTRAHVVDHLNGVTRIESAGQGHTEGHVAASRGITTRLIAESTSRDSLRRGGDAGAFKPGTRTKHKLVRLVQGKGGLTRLPVREGAVHGSTLRHIHTDPATSELTSLPLTLLLIEALDRRQV